MKSETYAKSLEGVLKSAREFESEPLSESLNSTRDDLLRAAALVAVLSMNKVADDRFQLGRQLGSAWSQDHRRTRMGETNVLEHRRKRSTWR